MIFVEVKIRKIHPVSFRLKEGYRII